jgi:hypothetical protein
MSDVDEIEFGDRVHPTLHLAAPVVAVAAVWLSRKAVTWTYTSVSGRTPPSPTDPRTTWTEAIVWTALIATTAAVAEVVVRRLADEREIVRRLQTQGQALSTSMQNRRHKADQN